MKYIIALIMLASMNANAIDKYIVCGDGTVATGSLTCHVDTAHGE